MRKRFLLLFIAMIGISLVVILTGCSSQNTTYIYDDVEAEWVIPTELEEDFPDSVLQQVKSNYDEVCKNSAIKISGSTVTIIANSVTETKIECTKKNNKYTPKKEYMDMLKSSFGTGYGANADFDVYFQKTDSGLDFVIGMSESAPGYDYSVGMRVTLKYKKGENSTGGESSGSSGSSGSSSGSGDSSGSSGSDNEGDSGSSNPVIFAEFEMSDDNTELLSIKNGNITHAYVPEGTISIADDVFYNCGSLKKVHFPSGIQTIGYAAFYNCKSLTTVTFPSSLKQIEPAAFQRCAALRTVVIPKGVTKIGGYAFTNCANLECIVYRGTVSEWKRINRGASWKYDTGDFTVECSDGTLTKAEA